jgi:hypothetical protein
MIPGTPPVRFCPEGLAGGKDWMLRGTNPPAFD